MNQYGIGIVSFEIGIHKGYENVRSAHIQIPVQLAKQLHISGNHVSFFTNKLRSDTKLPEELDNINVVKIPDPRKRKTKTVMYSGFSKKIDLINIVKGIYMILKFSKKNKIGVIHFMNGSISVGIYASVLALFSKKILVYWTPSTNLNVGIGKHIFKYLLSKLNGMVCHTDYHNLENSKIYRVPKTIKHGILRNFIIKKTNKTRVTFWRDPSHENGADIAKILFEKLADEFRDIIFTFMVRPYFDEINLNSNFENIKVYKFPYKENITLEKVLSETILCVFPFREFSTNPQLSILETLDAGIPCVCSDIESANEYGIDERLLIKNNSIDDYESAIRLILKNPSHFKPKNPADFGFTWKNYLKKHIDLYKL